MNTANKDRMLIAKKHATKVACQQRGLLRSVVAYEPAPIQQPKVDDDFGEMSVVKSTLEAIRYSAFLMEYTLAPNGWLRAWLVLWCRLFLLMVVPTVAVTVVMRLAVPLATNAAEAAVQVEIAVRATVVALGWLVVGGALVAAVIAGVGGLTRIRSRRRLG